MSSIEAGQILEGVVTGITNFGAFVLLPNGETGLVHISEVAGTYVRDINDYFQKKDKVKVKVLSVSNGKIGLSIKRALQEEGEEKVDKPLYRKNFQRKGGRSNTGAAGMSFEDKLAKFLKDSDEKQQDLKRNTESKRGGGRSSYKHGYE
ncbi:MAG TPA: S1 RNA-binding domain-containing protein [Firmicutes bacterium]|jgi:S1 RNA binding domain protein|nr:S1 RNA-binding domain-containing protein [Bacillota bacterium]